eukprot:CAMPEP_0168544740 /NCGR_PEP_ID=MMETSP0413-20121227/2583_1 /TAXON_ID=136452 /ORGANISM="Filamoeba nolandi, Strain NC-AS-23-1" /LENGTH=602 /DNA_ID=CAMNT_0008574785 /DNA_START=1 /DNA_END=1809 /DNA_ORIENTATION=+
MGMPIQRTNISVSGTANNPIAITTNTISNNPNLNPMPIPGYSAVPPNKQAPPTVGIEDNDWEKYTEKHNQLSARYSTILEQMMKQFERAAEAGNSSFESFKNRIQNFYRILKEPTFRPSKTPEESVKALEAMEKQIESWVHSITQRKSQPPSAAHPSHPQPPLQSSLPAHPSPPTVTAPVPVTASPPVQSPPTFIAPAAPHVPAADKPTLPVQVSPPIVAPVITVQPVSTVSTKPSEEPVEGSIEDFFTPGIITAFFDKLNKSTQDLKEMKTVLERISKTPTTEDLSGTLQFEDSSVHSKSLKPPSTVHHKRFWWSRDPSVDLNKVKQERLKSSDGSLSFGIKRAKKNEDSFSGTDTDLSGMHPIFPAVAKAVRVLMKSPEGRCFKRVFKSVDENKLFVELVFDDHKPEASGAIFLMQLELLPSEAVGLDCREFQDEDCLSVTVRRTVADKGHDSVSSVFIPALIEMEALSYTHDTETEKWVGFISCYQRYLEKYNALLSQLAELNGCGFDISCNINHDATILMSCRLASQVLIPSFQVLVTLDGKSHKPPEILYSEEHELFLPEVKSKLESKIRSLSRVVQQPTLPLLLSSWKSIVESQYL